jgi:hypothetical protein
VAPGEDDLSDSIEDPPARCTDPPEGFTFSIGSFNYGDTPAELSLSWTKGGCTVNDLWLLTQE